MRDSLLLLAISTPAHQNPLPARANGCYGSAVKFFTVRNLGRLFAGAAVSVLLVLLACIDTVDYVPYLKSDYYSKSISALRNLGSSTLAARGELMAGFGRARLTPTLNAPQDDGSRGAFQSMPLAGYGGRRGRPATGTHDDVYVKAIAVKVADKSAVFVGADLLIMPREVTELAAEMLEKEEHLPRSQLYLGATHSHSSLGGWGEGKVAEGFAGPFHPEVRKWIAGQVVSAARDALKNLKPATFGTGRFSASESIRNRLAGTLGRIDPEFSFAVFRQNSGDSAVLGSFSAHATVLGDRNMDFSGDYPGYWGRAVEKTSGGMAVFFAGAVGSQSPVPGEGAGGFMAAERLGEKLARGVVEQLASVSLTNVVTLDTVAVELELPPLQWRVSDNLRLRPWLAARLLHPPKRSLVQVFRLNNALWVSTPCDFSSELALDFKDFARVRGFNAVVTSFNGDYIGYIIPTRYYHLGGYEPKLMSFFGPYMADYLVDSMRALTLIAAADAADAGPLANSGNKR